MIGKDNEEEEVHFKVADRRKFNADGSLRDGVTLEPAKSEAKAEAAPEPPQPLAQPAPQPQQQAAPQQQSAPPAPGAKQAPDGNWYVPDPTRPGKYLQVGR